MAELTCPPLGTGSVDMNALNDAAKKAKTPEELENAVTKATVKVEPPADAPEDPKAADLPAAEA